MSKWTKEVPTEPGEYWMRPSEQGVSPRVVWVAYHCGDLCLVFCPICRDMHYIKNLHKTEFDDMEWQGPITPED